MKSVVIYFTSGRIADMMLEDDDYEKLCDWFVNDYGENKIEVETDDTIRILNKRFICEIDIAK